MFDTEIGLPARRMKDATCVFSVAETQKDLGHVGLSASMFHRFRWHKLPCADKIAAVHLLTAAQMRAAEDAAIESGRVTGLELMERAGHGIVDAVLDRWPELAKAPHRAVVLCGPGNNGGDGFVVARLLRERGWDVEVHFSGNPDRLPPDARSNYNAWSTLGSVEAAGDPPDVARADLLIDAVFGTGLSRPVENPLLCEWFMQIDDAIDLTDDGRSAPRTVAVDLPSGIDTDTGSVLGDPPPNGLRAPRVMLTVTFHQLKRAHRMGDGPAYCGEVVVKDIGL